ncbi:MAG: cysteine synthase family protein [Rickettsiales bacterium]|nr:cysteine synthase family protein [Rickettsiales bacterium]
MKYYNDFRELIGNTPMVKLNNIGFPGGINLFAKMEMLNPGGSIKDRIGIAMIEDAEKSGKLKRGGTIIEVTAGNTGIGLALGAVGKGYRVIFVVPTKFSQEKQNVMRILGAEIINTPKELGMAAAFRKAEELAKEIPGAFYATQFTNPANPDAHFRTTGVEIYNDLDGKIDYFLTGAGSGGVISGVAKYLKSKNRNIKVALVDPVGSTLGGGEDSPYRIEGIGNNFMPKTLDMSLIDDIIKISDDEAFAEVKQLAKKEGILAGSSSGAALAGARKLAEKVKIGNFAVIFSDSGERYLSKNIFD